MTRTLVALAILSLIATIPAAAQPDDWPKSIWREARKDLAAKRDKRRYSHSRTSRTAKRVKTRHRYPLTSRITTGSIGQRAEILPMKCVSGVSVVGDQAATTNGAKAQAEKAWQQQVRFLSGELYSDPRYAGSISFRCVDSSIRNIANRATEVIGINSQLKRCSMTAIPCRAPKVFEVSLPQ